MRRPTGLGNPDPLKIVTISTDLNTSSIRDGVAWGMYGSNVVSKAKYYTDYISKSKFTRFADKWSVELKKLI